MPRACLAGVLAAAGRAARWAGRVARRHAVFCAALLAAAAARIIAMAGYPAPMVAPDSADYVGNALRMQPNPIRPSGYPAVLWLLRPLHSLALVAAVQHAMGLGMGIAGYAVLRRRFGMPGWAATAAMVAVLFSAYAIQLEHFLLSDTLFALLVTIAVVTMMWRPRPPPWIYGLAGLLLALATLVRSQGIGLAGVFLVCLFIGFAGWRTVVGALVMCAAFAVPVAGYAAWFESAHGTFRLTSSTGAFLYSRVTTFADCAKIKPPAGERRLCLNVPVSERTFPPTYVWDPGSPIRAIPGGEFGALADRLGTGFALRAIRAQPRDYLAVVWQSCWESFLPRRSTTGGTLLQRIGAQLQRDYMFPAARPRPPPRYAAREYDAYDRAGASPRTAEPYIGWIGAYQRFVVVSGPLLGVIVVTGLAGLVASWRRVGGPALLPWLSGVVLLVTPDAVAAFDPRYIVCAIPPLCLAAAIGVRQIAGVAASLRARRASRGEAAAMA